ncbi:MAG: type II toxin-antitoxin system HicB family antitoxin [Chloroflexi bacterium]|nr:type II toxin-antitoxin system HicB family antitoxin [Chloroflexota bacterium]
MAKRTLEEYLHLPYTIEVTRDEEDAGWVARVVELPGCITQGEDFQELGEMIEDAMRMWIETAIEDGVEIPEPRPEESYSGKFVVRVPKSLHRELVETAEREGVSLNMYISTALGKAVGQYPEEQRLSAAETPVPLIPWPRLSDAARRVMIARGLSEEVQQVDEQLFAGWVDDYLDQAQTALEMAEYHQALQYIRTLRQGLDQLCGQSPLIRTYCRAAMLLEAQIVQAYRMYAGIVEQNRLQQRVLAQVRESTQMRTYLPGLARQESQSYTVENFSFTEGDFTFKKFD